MIPILFEKGSTSFSSNGLGRLSETISCFVTEERNGIYELEMVYPMSGHLFQYMVEIGGVICAWHDDKHDIQAFDIYAHSDPINGQVTFYAHHISYRLNRIIVAPFIANSPSDAMASLSLNAVNACPFTFWTDKTGSATMDQMVPSDIRSLLFGKEGSILDIYGKGEYQFDMLNVKLYVNRGQDTNVTIYYGKNLNDIKKEYDESDIFNAVAPYWTGENGVVTLPEVIVQSPNIPNTTYPLTDENGNRIVGIHVNGPYRTQVEIDLNPINSIQIPVPLDMSEYFENEPTEADLRAAAISYIDRNETWVPDENIKVDFQALWQTPEYESIAILQRVSLCDTVSVYYSELGVIAEKKKIIKVVYDVLLERYKSIELGTKSASLSETIADDIMDSTVLDEFPTQSMMEAAIAHATQMITGGLGGYVVIKPNANGYPEEILIMDTPDTSTAVHVIRMNQNGIGFSSNGYNGPFTSAWTIDGSFNADFITAGAINASLITVGSLVADIIKTGRVESDNGLVYFDLDNNELCCSKIVQNVSGSSGTAKVTAAIAATNNGGEFKIYKELSGSQTGPQPLTISFDSGGYAWISTSNSSKIGMSSGDTFLQLNSGGITLYAADSSATVTRIILNNSLNEIDIYGALWCSGNARIQGSLSVTGTKNRKVETNNYGDRLLYSYETAAPMFGDIGEGFIDEDGFCYVDIDDLLAESINSKIEYQVFLQKEGEGDIWVFDKKPKYFVVKGTPGMKFAWELKAKQKDYEYCRLENPVIADIEPPEFNLDDILIEDMEQFIQEMEGVLVS